MNNEVISVNGFSLTQQGIYFTQAKYPNSSLYNVGGYALLKIEVDLPFLLEAIEDELNSSDLIINRFAYFENTSSNNNDKFDLEIIDYSSKKDSESLCLDWMNLDIKKSLDPNYDLIKIRVFKISTNCFYWYVKVHHILFDGYSMQLFFNRVIKHYNALTQNSRWLAISKTSSFTAYVKDELNYKLSENYNADKVFWENKFMGFEKNLAFETGLNSQIKKEASHATRLEVPLSRSFFNQLEFFCTEHKLTITHYFIAIISLLNKLYGNGPFILQIPVFNRDNVKHKNTFGPFVKTIPFYIDFIENETSFLRLLYSIKKNLNSCYRHKKFPLIDLLTILDTRENIHNVIFSYQKNAYSEKINDQTSVIKFLHNGQQEEDLQFHLLEYSLNEDITLLVDYKTAAFAEAVIGNLVNNIKYFIENQFKQDSFIDSISSDDRRQLLVDFNATHSDYPQDKTIVDLFEAQVKLTPHNIALVFEDVELTYQELNQRVNQLSNYLKSTYFIGSNDIVGILLERSEWMIISILGILKSGAAYLPIDPHHPQERIDYIIEDSNCRLVINSNELNTFKNNQNQFENKNKKITNSPSDLVYAIYTSGTSGTPKAVLIEHKNLVNHIHNIKKLYQVDSNSKFLQFFNISFDAAAQEIFTALCFGAVLYMRNNLPVETTYIINLINEYGITHADFSTAFFNALITDLIPEKTVVKLNYCAIGGEKIEKSAIDKNIERIKKFTNRFFNVYGPTETTLTTTYYDLFTNEIELSHRKDIPIGKPNGNTQIYILNASHTLQPIGVTGEICISGDGLARGYLNRPELTAEKFVANPFKEGERLYKTGDLGRWLPDGNIEFIGRKDDQVKIRGYRIELGEIESALNKYKNIDNSVVIAKANESGEKELVAYLTSKEELNVQELRTFLSGTLPTYMVPSYFVQIEAIPLNANGKVDRKKLPDPQGLVLVSGVEYVAPKTEIEKNLVSVIEGVLKRSSISMLDNFFVLGGDSIKSIQVSSRLRSFGYSLAVKDILLYPTLLELTKKISTVIRLASQDFVIGAVPLGPIQKFFLEGTQVNKAHYNQSVLLYSKIKLSGESIAKALAHLTLHHDALRMVFNYADNIWHQENKPSSNLSGFEVIAKAKFTDCHADCDRIQSSFNLSIGPLFKLALFQCEDGDRLLFVAHHLIIDGVSWRIIFEDFSNLYQQAENKQAFHLPLKSDSFQYWQEKLQNYSKSEALEQESLYWSELENQTIAALPCDYPTGSNLVKDSASKSVLLTPELTALLLTKCYQAYRTEVNDVLLGALSLAFNTAFGLDKILINIEGHGREDIGLDVDVSRTIGWFTSVYPILFTVNNNQDAIYNLIQVKESLHRIPNKGLGYGILKYLGVKNYRQLPDIIFNYLGDFGSGVSAKQTQDLFEFSNDYHGNMIADGMERGEKLSVLGMIVDGQLNLSIGYSKNQYKDDTIENLLQAYQKGLEQLTQTLSQEQTSHLTPVDLTYQDLSIEQVQALNTENNLEDVYSLSPLQEGLYYHWLVSKDSSLYFEQMSVTVEGDLNLKCLEQSYQSLITRHSILRTHFNQDIAEQPLQIIKKRVKANFEYQDLSNAINFSLEVFKQADRERGFDLAGDSQMRLTVLKLREGSFEFVWSHHHILMDGWCMGIFAKEFFQNYYALIENKQLQLQPAKPYVDYIKWLNKIDKNKSLKYWQSYLSEYDTNSSLPKLKTSENELTQQKNRHEEFNLVLDHNTTKNLKAFCKELSITENTFVQSVWGILLSKYNNTNDVVFGAVVSGRPSEIEGVENMVGLFINTIPVRIKYEQTTNIKELLKQTHDAAINSNEHHYIQLAQIQEHSKVGQHLFDHILVFENYPIQEGILENNTSKILSIKSVNVIEQNNYDFSITIVSNDKFSFKFNYNTNAYSNELIARLSNHLNSIIQNALNNTSQAISQLNYLSPEETHQLIQTFNNTNADYPKDKTIVDLFEAQVKQTPNNIALVFEEKELTYKELNQKANQLAHYLRETYAIQPDDLIGILLERSEWMIIAILGALKSGGAYVPIDPEYPQERIDYMIQDSGCKVLINNEELEKFKTCQEKFKKQNPKSIINTQNLVYVIYTSGSTGNPKGVMIENGNVISFFENLKDTFFLQAGMLMGASTNYTFDISVLELLGSLTQGIKLFLLPTSDPLTVLKQITEFKIKALQITPSKLVQLLEAADGEVKCLTSLEILLIGGEPLSQNNYKKLAKLTPTKIINLYGPTETCIWSSSLLIEENTSLSIGKPLKNESIYILNDHQTLQPIGVTGEICISGDGLARGYLNRPELTVEKFVANPFKEGERMYKTGDLGRWLPDGNIEFIGRKDDQVKIRGYRIELGEIESALNKYKNIDNSVVIAKANESGEKELVAYLTSKEELNVQELRTFLSGTLPTYMVPSYFVQIEAIPLNANGKVDRKKLPDPQGLGLATGVEYIAARNVTETALVKIWEEILDRKNIGVKDNFFELGGHSLKATRLLSKIYRDLNVKLELKDLFAEPLLEQQANLIQQTKQTTYINIPKVSQQTNYQLSSAQLRLWVLSQFEESNVAYNMPGAIVFEGNLNLTLLEKAFQSLIERHEILRTSFKEDEQGEVKQFISTINDINFNITYQDLQNQNTQLQEDQLQQLIEGDFNKAFNLQQGPLLRAGLYQVEKNKYIFTYVMHHIISDGWSMDILVKEVLTFYNSYLQNNKPELKPLPIQYKDYACWQQAQLKDESIQNHKNYWLNQFSGELPVLELPSDKTRPVLKTSNGGNISGTLSQTTSSNLKAFCQKTGSTLFMGLLASVNALLHRYTNQQDIIIGSSMAGREHSDLEDQIGFYINTLALRSQFKGEDSFEELLNHTKQITLDAYAHQAYPFDELVDQLNLQRDMSRSALFDVMVDLHNEVDTKTNTKQHLDNISIISYEKKGIKQRIRFDLVFSFIERENEIILRIEYNSDLYKNTLVQQLVNHYQQLLLVLLQNPTVGINNLDYLSVEEKHQLLHKFNSTKVDYPKSKTILDLFEAQVRQKPNNIALVFENKELTYKELNEKANQLSNYLRETYLTQPDDLIGILLERSEWMIITILGILKSGAAYVPIDPEYPRERIRYIFDDSKLKVLITQTNYIFDLDYYNGPIFAIDVQLDSLKTPINSFTPTVNANNLAYVIYTSGSTGKSKGCSITHFSLFNYIQSSNEYYFKNNNYGNWAFISSLSFDLTITSIYTSLTRGKKLFITPSNKGINQLLEECFTHSEIDTIKLTPSHLSLLNQLAICKSNVRILICGGEQLTRDQISTIWSIDPEIKIYNEYGPTETTVGCTIKTIIQNDDSINIGRPISNTQIYILNASQTLQPIGVTGEICISGDGLARGYLNRPELTVEKFVANPFKEGERMYKTGDLGRWLPDGNIEFIGRKDDQVKIRGYRIELGEIESALNKYKNIDNSVVIAKANESGEKELVAYLTSKEELNVQELRTFLSGTLPTYMVPSYFVQIEAIPLNANGKVDRKKLPDPQGLGLATGVEYIAARNVTETALVKIWEEILDRKNIGVKDNFFELGGHSLKATRLLSKIYRDLNVKLELKDLFAEPLLEQQANLIQQTKQTTYINIPKVSQQTNYQLSSAQLRLWVLSQFEESNVAYNMPGAIVFEGNLNLTLLEKAFQSLIERHEILRTSFKEDEQGEVKQFISTINDINFNITYQDLQNQNTQLQEDQLQQLIEGDFNKAFNLQQEPLLRAGLYQVEKNKYIFTYVMHHIISDGWSMDILVKEVLTFYNSYLQNNKPELKPLSIQYKDYACWQQAQLKDESIQNHKNYWLNQFSGELPVLELPSDKTRPVLKTSNGGNISGTLSQTTSSNLKAFCQKTGSTLFMGLLASVNALLYRYTNQQDIIIGSPIAGREHSDLEDQIGFYINTLALRSQFKGEDSFEELLNHTKQITLDAYAHQAYPFDELVDQLNLQRDMSRSALFDVMVVLQNTGNNNANKQPQSLNDLKISGYDGDENYRSSKFDLTFNFSEMNDDIILNIQYNSDIYLRKTVKRILNHLDNMIANLLKSPNLSIIKIDYISLDDRRQLLVDFNATHSDYPQDKTIVDLFEAQVKLTPHNIALVFEDVELTYQELNQRVNQLSNYLKSTYFIGSNDIVGILLERSEWMIISILGILKSGAAYLPIDPHHPQERIDYIIEDSNCRLVINSNELNTFKNNQNQFENKNKKITNSPSDLVYAIYTSGTSGTPKAVLIEHKNLVNHIHNIKKLYQVDSNSKFLQFFNISFDAAAQEIFTALCFGAVLYMRNNLPVETTYIINLINEYGITHADFSTAFFNALITDLIPEKTVVKLNYCAIGGEKIEKSAIDKNIERIKKFTNRFFNVYGPTETTLTTTYYDLFTNEIELSHRKDIPIGKPNGNTQIYILNASHTLQPIGVTGEICISGDGLARGYLNRPELTAEKFVANPFKEGERMYKTGDLGRWLPDGNIEFIARKDDQVKIRGYRIELGEIESALNKYKNIDNSVVIAKANESGEKELVAYLTSKEELNVQELRTFLSGTLPTYMVPSYFVQIEAIPLNANGKVDRKKLPDPQGSGLATGVEYIAARNVTETALVKIWEEILDRKNIGVKDNFFELGGHSLKATRLLSKIYRDLNVKLELKDLFAEPLLEQQANLIQQTKQTTYINIPKVSQQTNYQLSSAQRRLWVLSQFEESNVAYNMPGAIVFEGNLNLTLLEKAFQSLIERHEILRTSFKEDEQGEVKQFISTINDINFNITYQDLQNQNTQLQEDQLQQLIEGDFNKAFNLQQGPLLRAGLYQVEKNKYIFTYVMHHIISDGWSMDILVKEVLTFYNSYLQNNKPELKPLSIQYKDYACWQQAQLKDESIQNHKNYWLNQFSGELPVLELPSDKTRPVLKTSNGGNISGTLSQTTSSNLKAFCQKTGSTLFMGLLASVNALLYRYTNQQDIIIGSPIAGREHSDLEDQIGFYINTLALRSQFKGEDSFEELLNHTKQITLDAYAHQAYPFDELVDQLNLQRDMSRSALFDVMVVLQNTGNNNANKQPQSLNDLKISGYENNNRDKDKTTSKFDLEFNFVELEDQIHFSIQYNSDLYHKETIARLSNHLNSIIQNALNNTSQAISQLNYLSPEETHQLIQTFNNTNADYPKDKTIVDLFEAQVKQTPNNIALVFEEKELTYKELNQKANQLAHYLRETYAIQPDDLIGILLERSEWMIIAILGALKSGGAYVPIDPEYPQERIDYMIQDSGCKVLINNEELEKFKTFQEKFKKQNPKSIINTQNLVYVIYTSGSTGNPKGVMIENGNLTARIAYLKHVYEISEKDNRLFHRSYSFDGAVEEYLLPLLVGSKCVIVSNDYKKDIINNMINYIDRYKITKINIPSVLLGEFMNIDQNKVNKLTSLKHIITGGDKLTEKIVNDYLSKFKIDFHNAYGPTENTNDSTNWKVEPFLFRNGNILIGKPIQNSHVYILDSNMKVLPIGICGELYVGGSGLGRGYLNRPELTAEKFIANPFKEGERMYKTGDLGRWLPDGNIEFIGREDDQVKIRGYRIELGEIENALNRHPDIETAIVITKTTKINEKDLVAYFVSKETLNVTQLRSYLLTILPSYMLPNFFIQIDSIPANNNGKIDRKKLPEPQGLSVSSFNEYIAARNEIEEKLVEMWEEILERNKVGVKDNFFELGGHSLKATRLIAKISKHFDVKVNLVSLFNNPTIENLSEEIENIYWTRNKQNEKEIDNNIEKISI